MPATPVHFAPYRAIAAEIAARLRASHVAGSLAPWPEEVIVSSSGVAEAITRDLLTGESGDVADLLGNDRGFGTAQPCPTDDSALGTQHSGLRTTGFGTAQPCPTRSVAGLQLNRLDELARRVLAAAGDYPRVASEGERRLAMRAAVRSIDDPIMTTRGIASMLERAYRDVRDSGLTLDDFRARVQSSSRALRNVYRTRLVIRAWSEYERLIAQLGAIDPAELFERAARALSNGTDVRPQLLAGFYDMTGVQFRLVEALRKVGRLAAAWMPIDDSPDYRFAKPTVEKLAADAEPYAAGRRETQPETSYVVHDTRIAELQATANAIRTLLDRGVEPRQIGVVARAVDPYDARLLHRFAAELGFGTTFAEETPLGAHRLGRGIITLLRLRERGFLRGDVIELLRDGLRTRTRVDIDRVDQATRSARIAGGTSEELRATRRRDTPVINDYITLVAELEQLTAAIDASTFGKIPGQFRLETPLDLEAAERIDSIAELFRRTSVWNRPFDTASAIDAIEHESLGARPDAAQRVWFGDVMTFRGRSFEHLFVMRMQDDVFPQRRNEDPLLPDSDRRALGLREIGDGRDEEQLLFRLLFDGSRSTLRFSYAGTDGFGKILRGSRLLRELPRVELDSSAATPRRNKRSAPARSLQLLVRSGTQSVFDGYLSPALVHERVMRTLQSISPTHLEDFGECPHKFLLKHILGVRDIDDPEREVQIHHREKGTLDHTILERFYRGTTREELQNAANELPRLPATLVARLEAIIDEEFDGFEAQFPPFNRTIRDIERRATKRILRDFVAFDIHDLAEKALWPEHFEYRFGPKYAARGLEVSHPESFTIDAEGVTIRIDGSIDRIDSDGERFRIVDYKSGKALRHKDLGKKIDRGVRLQLALYAMAVARFFEVDAAKVDGAIKPLVVGGDTRPQTFAFALAEKEAALVETLGIFVHAILGGVFPAFPNERDEDFNSCKYCPVNHSCRIKHDVDQRYAVQQHKDPRTLLQDGAA